MSVSISSMDSDVQVKVVWLRSSVYRTLKQMADDTETSVDVVVSQLLDNEKLESFVHGVRPYVPVMFLPGEAYHPVMLHPNAYRNIAPDAQEHDVTVDAYVEMVVRGYQETQGESWPPVVGGGVEVLGGE